MPGWAVVAVMAGGLAAFYVGLHLTIAIHETGHALAARVARVPVRSVRIGRGRLLTTFTVAGKPVELRLRPGDGHTSYGYPRSRVPELRMVIATAGGPLANLAVAAMAGGAARGVDNRAVLGVLVTVAWLNGVAVLLNLVPLPIGGGTDGWQLLALPLRALGRGLRAAVTRGVR